MKAFDWLARQVGKSGLLDATLRTRIGDACELHDVGWDSPNLASTIHNQNLFLNMEPVVEEVWPSYLIQHRLLLSLRHEADPTTFWARLTKKSMMDSHVREDEVLGMQAQLVEEKLLSCVKHINSENAYTALESWLLNAHAAAEPEVMNHVKVQGPATRCIVWLRLSRCAREHREVLAHASDVSYPLTGRCLFRRLAELL
jgi:hypothetical protein